MLTMKFDCFVCLFVVESLKYDNDNLHASNLLTNWPSQSSCLLICLCKMSHEYYCKFVFLMQLVDYILVCINLNMSKLKVYINKKCLRYSKRSIKDTRLTSSVVSIRHTKCPEPNIDDNNLSTCEFNKIIKLSLDLRRQNQNSCK